MNWSVADANMLWLLPIGKRHEWAVLPEAVLHSTAGMACVPQHAQPLVYARI